MAFVSISYGKNIRIMLGYWARIRKRAFANKQNDHGIIQAESLFTAFIVEHNLIAYADHAGPLLRKMCTDSETAKKYGCARTQTLAITAEMGKTDKNAIISTLKKVPFSIATDGSNKGDFKLYPLVVTFHNERTQKNLIKFLANFCIRR
ncbi:hypothetical protein AVEN_142131-1 [Araneus ventricosus]|uniref:DUF4371 domain-containing protein n=1 Tax=Araneus ventricosus TaxID=182803 RepID=A0A4Y2DIS2_ARAVE|nr:hypothetical protein AVEN_142131-1 [Araneus ventricosus]